MGKFLLRRVGYLVLLAMVATIVAYLLAATQLHPRSRYEGRNPAPAAAVVDQRLSEFSKGMKQKVLIASALMHRPDVLFLDEPLSGLDANAALVVKELIRSLAAQGRTIFFCSHVLEVVERVCSRIVIVNHGEAIADGTPAAIAARTGTATLEEAFVKLTGTRDAALITRDLLEALGG